MKYVNRFGLAALSGLVLLAGCCLQRQPVFRPPSVQSSSVDGGGTLVWTPAGDPFAIQWIGPTGNPCFESERQLKSVDGTSLVTCDLIGSSSGEITYLYNIVQSAQKGAAAAATAGPYSVKPTPCPNCIKLEDLRRSPAYAHLLDGTLYKLYVSCPSPGGPGTATSITFLGGSSATAGPPSLTVNDAIKWIYGGTSSAPTMTVTFQTMPPPPPPTPPQNHTLCSNNNTQPPANPFTKNGTPAFCALHANGDALPQTYTYSAKADDCSPTNGSLKVSAQ